MNYMTKSKESIMKLMVAIHEGADKTELLDIASLILTNIVKLEEELSESAKPDEDVGRAVLSERHSTQIEGHADEVAKVRSRLQLWAQRPHQFNHRILRLYLEMVRSGEGVVTTGKMEQAFVAKGYGDIRKFSTNFTQMANIAPNNHGKVFDVRYDRVSIWPPVAEHVAEFERHVLGE